MKKFRLSALVIMFCFSCIFFTACSGKSSDAGKSSSVSGGQKEKYIEKAQNVITLFNEEKSDEIVELCDETMKNALPKEVLSEVYTQIKSNGDFEKFLEGEMTKVEYLSLILSLVCYLFISTAFFIFRMRKLNYHLFR